MQIFRRRVGRKYLAAMLLSVSFILTLCAPASAQLDQWGYWENGVTEPWWFSSEDFTKDDAVAALARWKNAGSAQQDVTTAEWDGVYFNGSETHGTYLRWSPRGGFIIAHIDKCQARVMGLTYGRVEASPTLLQFFPEFDKAASRTHGHSHAREKSAPTVLRFVPVAWRGQRMLVVESEMSSFGDYVAGRGRYNYNRDFFYLDYVEFFTQRDATADTQPITTQLTQTEEKTADDATPPVVPPAYVRFLKPPIEGAITAVGKREVRNNYSYQSPDGSETAYGRVSLTYVTVNAGAARGLKSGMFLRVAEPDGGELVRIIRAGRHASSGIVIRSLDEADAETFFAEGQTYSRPKVTAGWKLTTAPF
ncbi:MAG TPA: hypothetical protein VGB76_20375 [Pyrinomonadaceae bacterium]